VNEWIWDTLEIAPTDEVATIRSAYAYALKKIDMDSEPQRFIALRNARDYAIHEIRQAANARRVEAAEADQAAPAADGAEAGAETDVGTLADQRPSADTPVLPQGTFEDLFSALAVLLAPGQDDVHSPTVDTPNALSYFNAILANERLQDLAFRVQAETRLADLIAASLPRSESLVKPAIAAFKWVGPARIDTPPAIAALLDAAQSIDDHRAANQQVATARPTAAAPANPEAAVDADLYSGHYNALAALFFPQIENPPSLTPEEKIAARAHFSILIADPRMELVTFRVGAEAQFAQLIAYSIPRSDCVVPTAIDFFEWAKSDGRVDQPDMIAYILNRARGIRFLDAVTATDHPLHAAWTELTTPLGDKKRPAVSVPVATVHHLLTAIRTEQPLIERDLDPARVAMWDEKLAKYGSSAGPPRQSGRRIPLWGLAGAIFLILSILGQLAKLSDGPANTDGTPTTLVGDRSSVPDAMAGSAVDIDPVLAEIGGNDLSLLTLRDKNTALSTQLDSKWLQARDERQSLSDFQKALEKFLLDRVALTVANASDAELIADYQRQRLNTFKTLQSGAPSDCVELARPGKVAVNDVPVNFSDQRKALYARILERDDIVPAAAPPVALPLASSWISTAGKRIGVPPARMQALLDGRVGSYNDQCDARIAEFETLLALPSRASVSLLRSI
jgi:hypothetical protein